MEISLQTQLNHFIYPFCVNVNDYFLKQFLFVINQTICSHQFMLLAILSFTKNLNIMNPEVYLLIASDLCLILILLLLLLHIHFNFYSLRRYHLNYHPHPHLHYPHLHHLHHHHHHDLS